MIESGASACYEDRHEYCHTASHKASNKLRARSACELSCFDIYYFTFLQIAILDILALFWESRTSKRVTRNVQRFRGGLVFKAHRLLYHSTLGLRVIKKKKKKKKHIDMNVSARLLADRDPRHPGALLGIADVRASDAPPRQVRGRCPGQDRPLPLHGCHSGPLPSAEGTT